jgi:hypothetical protein
VVATVSAFRALTTKRLATFAAGLLAALFLLTACGSAEQDYIEDTYDHVSTVGDTDIYRASSQVRPTADDIAQNTSPAARADDGVNEYLRYDENIVIVRPDTRGGSEISVEDLDGNFRRGAYAFLGAGFRPSDAPDDGGPGDSK